MRRLLKRLRARFQPVLQSDTAFIDAAYREILGRTADQDGLNHYLRVLREGVGRSAVLLDLMRSEEFTSKLRAPGNPSIPNLRDMRPDHYRQARDLTNQQIISVLVAASPSDFDWLEAAILQNKYYEQPGVWNLGIDTDKRVVSEIVASFAPQRPLELGCAAGAVLECLQDSGIAAEGVEISAMALARASAHMRPRIHHGDLLSLDLPAAYDLVFGLDVFEHLNPNKLDAYLGRLAQITRDDAYFFCNIPAFGNDPVFGTVFPFYIEGWERDAAAGRPFSTIQVDDLGYPIHGHLTWADARWWSGRFEAFGFHREVDIERALHRKYDSYMQKRSPARQAYFVFAKNPSSDRRAAMISRINSERSRVLG